VGVSNRIFDVLACGTPVISDYLPEVHEVLGEAVPMFRAPDELSDIVSADLEDPTVARSRAAEGREAVLAAHAFDHRARELLEHLARHGLDQVPAAVR
jgi:spore maturation protein CgeB